jgi:hypothetical protein
VVVSEETGRISLAAGGDLKQGLSIAELERQINLHFGVRKTSGARAEEFPADLALEAPADAVHAERGSGEDGRP